MAPSLRDIRHAVTKKRKARESRAHSGRRAVAKIPKRISAGRAAATAAVTAETSHGSEEARPPTINPVTEEAEGAEASADVARGPADAVVPPAPAAPIPDSPPESVARAPSPPAETVGPDAAVEDEMPASHTVGPPDRDATSAPPLPEAPRADKAPETSRAEEESSPSKDGSDVDPSLRSILDNHGRWAEYALKGASIVEIQRLLRSQDKATFFREASVAHLWAANSLIALKHLSTLSDAALNQAGEEMSDLQAKAERAEKALEDARVTWKGKAEAARLRAEQAEYALEVAQRKAAIELDNALVAEEHQKKAVEGQKAAEEKLKEVESEMHILMDKLHSATFELNIVTKKAERAEDAARHADVEIAVLKVKANEAEREATEAKEKATEAERKMAEAEKKATEAVDSFRKSRAFDKELADATAFAYESGFRDCKEKIKRLHNFAGIEDLEPDEASESDDPSL